VRHVQVWVHAGRSCEFYMSHVSSSFTNALTPVRTPHFCFGCVSLLLTAPKTGCFSAHWCDGSGWNIGLAPNQGVCLSCFDSHALHPHALVCIHILSDFVRFLWTRPNATRFKSARTLTQALPRSLPPPSYKGAHLFNMENWTVLNGQLGGVENVLFSCLDLFVSLLPSKPIVATTGFLRRQKKHSGFC
jgi:hypothetical protein